MSNDVEKVGENKSLAQILMGQSPCDTDSRADSLSRFDSVDQILEHLANSSPKDREAFLKPWATKKDRQKIGRRQRSLLNDFIKLYEFLDYKTHLENEQNCIFSERKALEALFDNAGFPVDEADKYIKTMQNRFSSVRKRYKWAKRISDVKSSSR